MLENYLDGKVRSPDCGDFECKIKRNVKGVVASVDVSLAVRSAIERRNPIPFNAIDGIRYINPNSVSFLETKHAAIQENARNVTCSHSYLGELLS